MEQGEPGASDELIDLAEAARRLNLNKSTISRQAGVLFPSYGVGQDKKVIFAEVVAGRQKNVHPAIRGNHRPVVAPESGTVAPINATARNGATVEDAALQALIDEGALPLNDARALKETYLARIARLKYEQECKNLISVDLMHKLVFEKYRQDRDSWVNWVAQNAPVIAAELGVDQVKFAVAMEEHVRKQLAERAHTPIRIPD